MSLPCAPAATPTVVAASRRRARLHIVHTRMSASRTSTCIHPQCTRVCANILGHRRARTHVYTHTLCAHAHMHLHTHPRVRMRAHVCVCERERVRVCHGASVSVAAIIASISIARAAGAGAVLAKPRHSGLRTTPIALLAGAWSRVQEREGKRQRALPRTHVYTRVCVYVHTC